MKNNLLVMFVLLVVISVPNIALCTEETKLLDTCEVETRDNFDEILGKGEFDQLDDQKAIKISLYLALINRADNYSIACITVVNNRMLDISFKSENNASLRNCMNEYHRLTLTFFEVDSFNTLTELEEIKNKRESLRNSLVQCVNKILKLLSHKPVK